jgi:uncharacterized membrane protein
MNKATKTITSISVAVVAYFIIFVAIFSWNAFFNPIFVDAFIWWKYGTNYSKFNSILGGILLLSTLIWTILTIFTYFIYKYWADKNKPMEEKNDNYRSC